MRLNKLLPSGNPAIRSQQTNPLGFPSPDYSEYGFIAGPTTT